MRDLPADWSVRQLSSIADVRLGRQRSPKNHLGPQMRPYLRAANVGWAGLKLNDVKSMNFSDREMNIFRLNPGDLLLSEASGSPGEVGKPALWSGELDDCAFQNTLIRIRPHDIEPRYLLHYFRYIALKGGFTGQAPGVGIHHLGRARIAGWRTPVPPPDQQRQIVDILDEHLSAIEASVKALELGCQRLGRMRVALLQALWKEAEGIGELMAVGDLGSVVTGSTPPSKLGNGFGGEIPFITPSDIAHGGKISSWKRTLSPLGAKRARVLQEGSVLAVCIGSVGKVGWVQIPVATNQQINAIQPHSEVVESGYLASMMAAPLFQRQMLDSSSSTTMSILNKSKFSALSLPVPVMRDQLRLEAQAAAWNDLAVRLDLSLGKAAARADSLRLALLAAAFSGWLTRGTTDTEMVEEMASV